MPNNNIILTNPTVAAASQFTTPFNIATVQENSIQLDIAGFRNPTEFAGFQFNDPFNIATVQENLISNPTIPYTPQLSPASPGNDVGTQGQFQQAAGIANPIVIRTNPTIGPTGATIIDPSQPYDILTITEQEIFNDLLNKNLSQTGSANNKWENPETMPSTTNTVNGQNTNITPKNLISQALGIGSTLGGSLLAIPQVTQIGNTLINQIDGLNPATYLTLPKNRLKPVPGVTYSDFRSRFTFPGAKLKQQIDSDTDISDENSENFFNTPNQTAAYLSSRRLDGTAAILRGSWRSAAYAAASVTPVGAYSVFNLDGFGFTGFGWGDHDNPYALRADFTSASHVATRYKKTKLKAGIFNSKKRRGQKSRKGGFIGTGDPLELATPFRGDRVNVIDFGERTLTEAYLWKPVRFEFEKDDKFHGLKLTQDFIKFYFTGPALANGKKNADLKDDIIVFRAILTNLSDSFTAQWNPVNMIGRADPNYHYTGFSRDLSVSFDIYATDRDEVKPIYRKLNALAGYAAPTYDPNSIAMEAPWLRITIGDLFVQQPVALTSLSYTYGTDASWEINIENDPQMMQVPLKIGVQCSFNLVTDYLPKKGGNFYTLAKEFDENAIPLAGNRNWLSDFDAAPLQELPRIEKTIFKGKQSGNTTSNVTTGNESLTRVGNNNSSTPNSADVDLVVNTLGQISGF